MDLKRTRSFVVLASELHFGRAAQRLNIVQPALSQHIRQLEEELGVRLFDRSSRRVALTESGVLFLGEARRALQHLEAAAQLARDAAGGLAGRLTVGFVDNAIWSVVPAVVRAFRTQYPRVELDLRQMARAPQAEALARGELDVAIMPGPVARAAGSVGFSTQLLRRAPLHVALPAGHRLCAEAQVPIAALADERFVSFASIADRRRIDEIIMSFCAEAGFTPVFGQAVEQMHTALALVSTGFGVAIVPPWMRRAWTDNIAFRPLSPARDYELLLVTREGHVRPSVASFQEVAAAQVATAGPD